MRSELYTYSIAYIPTYPKYPHKYPYINEHMATAVHHPKDVFLKPLLRCRYKHIYIYIYS